MKMKRIIPILLALLMIVMVSCAAPTVDTDSQANDGKTNEQAQTDENNKPESNAPDQNGSGDGEGDGNTPVKKTYSILFIGNSYTYYNDMPTALFEKIAESAGYEVEVSSITKGSHTLSKFADPTDTYGAKVDVALKGTKKYDFVILQEQSVTPATDSAPEFYSAVRNLSERIRAAGAEPILYSTWGRNAGSGTLNTYGWTTESMTWKLAAAYQAIGDALNIRVAHVGLAFFDARTNPRMALYDSDNSHPSYSGSYLAAATLFAEIFDADPTAASYVGSLSQTKAEYLLQAAKRAVFETPAIPDEYKVSL